MNRAEFTSKIKRIRAGTGLTQREFAKLLGVHHRTINGAERGENKNTSGPFSTLIYLCEYPEVLRILKQRLKAKEAAQ